MTTWQCHNTVGWWGLGKEKCVCVRVCDPWASENSWPLHAHNIPPEEQKVHSRAIQTVHVWVQVLRPSKPLLFHFWEMDPLLLYYPPKPTPTPPISKSCLLLPRPNVIRNCLKHPATAETSWPALLPAKSYAETSWSDYWHARWPQAQQGIFWWWSWWGLTSADLGRKLAGDAFFYSWRPPWLDY